MKPEQRIKELEQEIVRLGEKYRLKDASWHSLRDLYNREFRENNTPEIRMLKAQLAGKRITDKKD